MLKVGETAPEFCLLNEEKQEICLSKFKGKWIVLYFYPKDQSPGCTHEACDFTDSHLKFIQKKDLSIILLSDEKLDVIESYQAKNTSLLGKLILPVKRVTYIINPEGKIAKTWSKVNVFGHSQDVKNSLLELQN